MADSALFQFHKGTIRTDVMATADTASSEFQFHKGTIRTRGLRMVQKRWYISIP